MVWTLEAMMLPHGCTMAVQAGSRGCLRHVPLWMTVWGRGLHQELWYVVDGNIINSALYGEKQVVIKVGVLYGLVDNKMVYLSSQWMGILKYRRYCLKVS